MSGSLKAGVAYFAAAFAAGFALGTIRVLLLVPRVGETAAVLLELPIILTVSWFACAWLVERFCVPADWRRRLVMGSVAFGLLMIAEVGVSVLLFARSLAEHLGVYQSWSGALGLAGQIAYAAMPVVQR